MQKKKKKSTAHQSSKVKLHSHDKHGQKEMRGKQFAGINREADRDGIWTSQLAR